MQSSAGPPTIQQRTTDRRPRWLLVAAASAGLIVVGGAASTWFMARHSAPSQAPPPNQLPAACTFGDLEFSGITHAGQGTLISAGGRCHVTVRRSKLTSDTVIETADDARVTILDSVITGRESAIRLTGTSHLSARGETILEGEVAGIIAETDTELVLSGTTVSGKEYGIKAGSHVSIDASDTKVSGDANGIFLGSNGHILGRKLSIQGGISAIGARASLVAKLEQSSIVGNETAIETGLNSRLQLTDSEVTAQFTAIESDSQLEFVAENSQINGKERAISAAMNAQITLTSGTRLMAGRTGVEAKGNLRLRMKSATIESADVGVCATFNASLNANGSRLIAPHALRLQQKPVHWSAVDTTVTGLQRFDSSDCPEVTPRAADVAARKKAAAAFMATRSSEQLGADKSFSFQAAKAELDLATIRANAACGARRDPRVLAVIEPVFSPDGSVSEVRFKNERELSAGSKTCIRGIFKAIRIPAYRADTPSPYSFRLVAVKPTP